MDTALGLASDLEDTGTHKRKSSMAIARLGLHIGRAYEQSRSYLWAWESAFLREALSIALRY